eukprot:maker-scaffold1259_size52279-snap-gene-0.11 protein:Tk02680 transcript:maker-scaffold1259_size52279-snap-gene-0.11-mRNA-1 annotation:"phage minor structural protein"
MPPRPGGPAVMAPPTGPGGLASGLTSATELWPFSWSSLIEAVGGGGRGAGSTGGAWLGTPSGTTTAGVGLIDTTTGPLSTTGGGALTRPGGGALALIRSFFTFFSLTALALLFSPLVVATAIMGTLGMFWIPSFH